MYKRQEETGEPTESGQVVLYSTNGVDWDSVELAGDYLHYINADDELLLFSTAYHHEDGQYSVTRSYLVQPQS